MVKKGPIGKVEGFYIEQNYKNMEIAQIATDLNRQITSVENYIKKHIVKATQTVATSSGLKAGEQFIRQDGITIMTENASTLGDAKKVKSTKSNPCITKIKP
jgi:hypothetical protein